MRRYLPFAIVITILLIGVLCTAVLYRIRMQGRLQRPLYAAGKAGAEPAHVLGADNARADLEEFGDFECMPCFFLWPALKNLEHDFGVNLRVTFREHPLPQHSHARDAARAAEAAGLQGRFWEMHDLLYQRRATWTHADDVRAALEVVAKEAGVDVDRFAKDVDSPEVASRIMADESRGTSLGIDRTPVLFLNGRRLELQPDVEKGLHADIEAALR